VNAIRPLRSRREAPDSNARRRQRQAGVHGPRRRADHGNREASLELRRLGTGRPVEAPGRDTLTRSRWAHRLQHADRRGAGISFIAAVEDSRLRRAAGGAASGGDRRSGDPTSLRDATACRSLAAPRSRSRASRTADAYLLRLRRVRGRAGGSRSCTARDRYRFAARSRSEEEELDQRSDASTGDLPALQAEEDDVRISASRSS